MHEVPRLARKDRASVHQRQRCAARKRILGPGSLVLATLHLLRVGLGDDPLYSVLGGHLARQPSPFFAGLFLGGYLVCPILFFGAIVGVLGHHLLHRLRNAQAVPPVRALQSSLHHVQLLADTPGILCLCAVFRDIAVHAHASSLQDFGSLDDAPAVMPASAGHRFPHSSGELSSDIARCGDLADRCGSFGDAPPAMLRCGGLHSPGELAVLHCGGASDPRGPIGKPLLHRGEEVFLPPHRYAGVEARRHESAQASRLWWGHLRRLPGSALSTGEWRRHAPRQVGGHWRRRRARGGLCECELPCAIRQELALEMLQHGLLEHAHELLPSGVAANGRSEAGHALWVEFKHVLEFEPGATVILPC
mmetsp:Transcript_16651/g.35238  ORF Transcript_16651/g.35238 Transcript_16651/m.35238 type:complete len:363 (-) Transcript_16651:597-1685(-)